MIYLVILILFQSSSFLQSFSIIDIFHKRRSVIYSIQNSNIQKDIDLITTNRSYRYVLSHLITSLLTINTVIINPSLSLASSDDAITSSTKETTNNIDDKKESLKTTIIGKTSVDGEANRIFAKARQCESDGDNLEAQKFYEEVIGVEPTFIYAWANLGNVLTAEGNLQQALLCYKKAISLYPPKDTLSVILLNKAAIELSLGENIKALKDLEIAEKISGPLPTIVTNKAVALSIIGKWNEASDLFETVISSGDRNALPWWLRYSMSLLETSRGTEAVAYLQRTLKSFPNESESTAFACALYTSLGTKIEALNYWNKLSIEDQNKYTVEFVTDNLHWGTKSISNYKDFLNTEDNLKNIRL